MHVLVSSSIGSSFYVISQILPYILDVEKMVHLWNIFETSYQKLYFNA